MSRRAIAYIDGYNLYYGLLKGTPYKWLDLWAFSRALLLADIELVAVKYFTAPIRTYPHDLAASDRQKIYLQAISAVGNVEVIHGFYSKNKALAPFADPQCSSCDVTQDGFVPIVNLRKSVLTSI